MGCIVLGSMCVGVSVWLGWSGIRVAGFSLQHEYHFALYSPLSLQVFIPCCRQRYFLLFTSLFSFPQTKDKLFSKSLLCL